MKLHFLHEKAPIEQYLRRDAALHLYELGDLDDFFWPYTSWFGLSDDGGIKAVALLYAGTALPVLLALGPAESEHHAELLRSLLHLLPARFYCHLTPGLDAVLNTAYRLESHGRHLKMTLAGPNALPTIDILGAERLGTEDEAELTGFLRPVGPLVMALGKRQWGRDLRNLKALMEAGTL